MTVHGRGKYISVAKRNALAAAATASSISHTASAAAESQHLPPTSANVTPHATDATVDPAPSPLPSLPPRGSVAVVVPSTLPLPTDFGYSKSEVATLVRQYLKAEFPTVARLFEHEAKHILPPAAAVSSGTKHSSTPRSLYSILREFVELKSSQRLSHALRDYSRIHQPPSAFVGVLQGINHLLSEYEARREEFEHIDFNNATPVQTQQQTVPASSNASNVLAQGTVSPAFASFFTTPLNNASVSHSSFLPSAAPTSSRALASAFAPSPASQRSFPPVAAIAAPSSSSSSSQTFAQPLLPAASLQTPSSAHQPPTSTELSMNSTTTATVGAQLIPPSTSPNKRRRKGSSPKKRIIPTVVPNTETNAAGLLTADAELPSNTLLEYLRGSVSKLQSIGLDMRVNPEGLDALEHNTDLAVVLANYINQTNPFDKHQSHPHSAQPTSVAAVPAAAASTSAISSSSPSAGVAGQADFLPPPPVAPVAHTTSAASAMEIQQHATTMDTSNQDVEGVESFALSDDILREITEKCLQDRTTAAFIDNAFAFNPNRQAESMWSPTSQDSASMVEFETPMDSTTYTENSPHKSPQQSQPPAAGEQMSTLQPTTRSRSPAKVQSRGELTHSRDTVQPSPIRATLRSASNGPPAEGTNAAAANSRSGPAPTASPSRSNSTSSGVATRSLAVALNVSSASPRLRRGTDGSSFAAAAAVHSHGGNPLHSTSSNASAASDQESTVSTIRKKRKVDSSV